MQDNYNRRLPQNNTQKRCRVEKNEIEVLLSLFENKIHRQLVMLFYGEGYTLEKCAEIMFYSKRHIERTKKEVDKIALYSLLKMVANSDNALKLLQIKNIILQ